MPGLIKPSTKAFWKEGRRTPGFGIKDFIHGYLYARFPYAYISAATSRHPLSRVMRPLSRLFAHFDEADKDASRRAFAHSYHGKAVPPDKARQLIEVNRPVDMDVEQVLPYDTARQLILDESQRIVLLDCPCRASMPNPCLPLDVCLIIGDPIAGFIAEHHPKRAREITVDEALAVLQAEHQRGHVHHAFFKDAMLGRFYAICNCCSCCCGAMWAHGFGVPMLCSSGYVAISIPENCVGCGLCAKKCPFQAIVMEGEGKAKRPVIDAELCMGCGVCLGQCPSEALRLELDPTKPAPLDTHTICA